MGLQCAIDRVANDPRRVAYLLVDLARRHEDGAVQFLERRARRTCRLAGLP